MKVALVDVDGMNKRGKRFPNLALMKLSAWHKAQGHTVEWYDPLFSRPDKIYASKIFTFSPYYADYAPNDPRPIVGGTGYGVENVLNHEVEYTQPDYSLYPDCDYALGFATRGCIRKCPWCIVPQKEGYIRAAQPILHIANGRKNVVLMDNNFLAAPEGFITEELECATRHELRLDFNQGLDARLVDQYNAKLLAACRWIEYVRFSCDTLSMLDPVKEAIRAITAAGIRRKEFFVYLLVTNDIGNAEKRLVMLMKFAQEIGVKISPFAQPYRDFRNSMEPTEEMKRFSYFVNVKGGKLCLKMKFNEYVR